MFAVFRFGTVPIKSLQYGTHSSRSLSALRGVAMLHFEYYWTSSNRNHRHVRAEVGVFIRCSLSEGQNNDVTLGRFCH